MKEIVIVGGGLSGLLMADLLRSRGIPFVGFESSDLLGGRTAIGHHRFNEESSAEILRKDWNVEVAPFEMEPKSRSKSEWGSIGDEWAEDEKFYLQPRFFRGEIELAGWTERLKETVGDSFITRREVTSIDPTSGKVFVQDGREVFYSKVFWCTSLNLLTKVWQGDKLPLLKLLKDAEEARAGINVDMFLKVPLFETGNTMVFPFRFKEHRLRALGMLEKPSALSSIAGATALVRWMLLLDEEIAEDHEEVAKAVRALKRELEKEFPDLKDQVVTEKISFLPSLSGEFPVHAKSLEVLPGITYLGPEVYYDNTSAHFRNQDLILSNLKVLREGLDLTHHAGVPPENSTTISEANP